MLGSWKGPLPTASLQASKERQLYSPVLLPSPMGCHLGETQSARELTSKVRSGTTMVIQLSAIVMCVLLCSAITSMERKNRTDHTM